MREAAKAANDGGVAPGEVEGGVIRRALIGRRRCGEFSELLETAALVGRALGMLKRHIKEPALNRRQQSVVAARHASLSKV